MSVPRNVFAITSSFARASLRIDDKKLPHHSHFLVLEDVAVEQVRILEILPCDAGWNDAVPELSCGQLGVEVSRRSHAPGGDVDADQDVERDVRELP